MKSNKGSLTLKLFFLIIMTDVTESIAELFFKKGALSTGIENVTFQASMDFFFKLVSSHFLWIGIIFYMLNFAIWIIVLSRIDLSIAFPVGSTTYLFVPILSLIFLHEEVYFIRWAGIILIIFGICLISNSTKEKVILKHEP